MTTPELLEELRRRDVRLAVETGRLKVNAPKGALTPGLQQVLSERKAEVIALLESATAAPLDRPPLVAIPRTERLPASFMQERLWYLHQIDPESAAYNVVAAFRVNEPLDRAALELAWRRVSERHEALRTALVAVDGRPMQEIREVSAAVAWHDVSELAAAERESTSDRLIEAAAVAPFRLDRAPLARATVVRLSAAEHAVLLTLHHAIADQWSIGILMQELSYHYRAAVAGRDATLFAQSLQYADYADWQRRWLESPAWTRQLAYWKRRLDGVRPLDLPTDFPRPRVQGSRGNAIASRIPKETLDAVQSVAARSGATAPMVLLAGYATLLWRYTSQSDLAIGMPVANRDDVSVERIVGALINTLVLRLDLDGDPTVADLIGRVRAVMLEAQEHRDAPFERLVAELQPARAASHAPLAQVMFIIANAWVRRSEQDFDAAQMLVNRRSAQLDLALGVEPTAGAMVAEYSVELFEERTIRRLLDHYARLLASMAANPDARLSQLDLLGPEEQARMASWNQTRADYNLAEGVEDMVRSQCERAPESIAVTCEGRSLTYSELEKRACHLAAYLRGRGVGRESLVGVCLRRSTDLPAVLLGILKTGAAYVPLDPAFPAQRLSWMVEDSGLRLILIDTASEKAVPQSNATVVNIEEEWASIANAGQFSGPTEAQGEDLAYVLYTSGSTGRPKGVQVPRRALTNFIRSMQEQPGMSHGDVLLAVTTLSFDISGLELFLPLSVGATIALATREEAADGTRLAALIESSGATVLQATPATWRLLLESGWAGSPRLHALCGGEAMPPELAAQLLSRTKSLWNMYGPTETTIWSTLSRVEPDRRITIGKPIANTQVHILDPRLRPVPVGVPGELCIAGDGVARGYLGRADLTADRFVPDPFAATGRMYRTGDLARWLADGEIECLGRIDRQVKIRGFRIELGEIESVLERHPAIAQAVAHVHEEGAGDRRLVAYVVYVPGEDPTASELRKFVRQDLPDYMVPSVFVALAQLPLTPNGKVDRGALPSPYEQTRRNAPRVAPRTDTERVIADIWTELLKTDVSVHDNFFEAGGHSLLSTQALARIEARLGVHLNPTQFIMDTLEQIAASCDRLRQQPAPDPVEVGSQRSSLFRSIKENLFG